MSSSRSMELTALLVWTVEKTRCPVMAARMAMSAVSPSRISPTAMISGSWRSTDRRTLAKVRPVLSLICTWQTPSMLYSTGSSRLTRFTSSRRSRWMMAERVEVLPEPVGPTIRIIPSAVWSTSRQKFSRLFPASPMPSREESAGVFRSRRATTFSPWMVGRVEIRRSSVSCRTVTLERPSWGSCFWAMSIRAMIFIRLITGPWSSWGTVITGRRAPSMRMRMTMLSSPGSMWISLAPSVQARSMMEFTSRMAGAASASSSSTATPGAAMVAAGANWLPIRSRRMSSMACIAPWLLYRFCTARSTAAAVAISGTTRRRVTARTSSMATKFRGSAMATWMSVRVTRTGTTRYFLAMLFGTTWASSGAML